MLNSGRWARKWDCCQGCGTTERPHKAKGLCKRCYGRSGIDAACGKRYRQTHPGRERERKRKYYQHNKERDREYHRERRRKWEAENRQRVRKSSRHRCAKRRAIARKLPATLTTSEWEDILQRYDYACAYCGIAMDNLQQVRFVLSDNE